MQLGAQRWGFLALTIHLNPGEKPPHKREQHSLQGSRMGQADIQAPSSPSSLPSSDQLHSWLTSLRLPRLGTGQTCLDHRDHSLISAVHL